MHTRLLISRLFRSVLYFLSIGLLSIVVMQSSFAAPDQGALTATTKGTASAGANVLADDPSVLFFNPAALTQLNQNMITVSMALLNIKVRIRNTGTTTAAGVPTTGDSGARLPAFALPNMYALWNYSPKLKFALGVTIPFGGIGVFHGNNWFGRYFTQDGRLKTLNIEPAFAWKINDLVSIGGGVDVQYIEFLQTNAIDFGLLTGGPAASQTADGQQRVLGQNVALGYDLGVTLQLTPTTLMGLSYHSPITQHVRGTADFNGVPAGGVPGFPPGAFTPTYANLTFYFPRSFAIGLWQKFNQHLSFVFDLTAREWSRQDRLVVMYDNPAQPTVIIPFDWHDILRWAIGAIYKVNDIWTFRAGVASDPTSTTDTFRSLVFPEPNKVIVAFGFSYRPNHGRVRIDVTYQRHFGTQEGVVANTNPIAGTARASAYNTANALLLQLNLLEL